jgi:hypothetical protein
MISVRDYVREILGGAQGRAARIGAPWIGKSPEMALSALQFRQLSVWLALGHIQPGTSRKTAKPRHCLPRPRMRFQCSLFRAAILSRLLRATMLRNSTSAENAMAA